MERKMSIRNKLREIKLFDWLETQYYNITIGIGNIFRWLPIVWQDRDWEYESYTEKFIYRKLKDLQKRNYPDIFIGGEWAQGYLNLCIKLIDEKRKMQNLEDDLWKSIEHPNMDWVKRPDGYFELHSNWSSPEAKQNYYDVEMKRAIREKKINHLIYLILETRGGTWWD